MSESADTNGGSQNDQGVGALLRASRLRIGEELRDVALMLRIRYPYLEAIEEGRFNDLPGQAYAVGFIRAYAEHLGLDSEEVVRRYKAEVETGKPQADLHFPTPVTEAGVPGGAIVFIGVLIAILAYGGWYLSTTKEGLIADLIDPLPDRLAALVSKDQSEPDAGSSAEPAEKPSAAPPSVPEPPAPVEPSATDTKATSPTVSTAPAEPEPVAAPVPPQPEPERSEAVPPAPDTAPETAPQETARTQSEPAPETTPPASAPTEAPPESTTVDAMQSTAPEPLPPAPESDPVPVTAAPAEPAAAPDPQTVEAPVAAASQQTVVENTASLTPVPVTTEEIAAPAPPEPASAEAETAAVSADAGSVTPETETPASSEPEVAAVSEPEETPIPAETKTNRILVRAKANSWIEVRDEFGNELLFSGLMRAGDEYKVPDQLGLRLITGNAGALDVLVDGELAPPIGAAGDIRRGVVLDPERLKAGTAVSP